MLYNQLVSPVLNTMIARARSEGVQDEGICNYILDHLPDLLASCTDPSFISFSTYVTTIFWEFNEQNIPCNLPNVYARIHAYFGDNYGLNFPDIVFEESDENRTHEE